LKFEPSNLKSKSKCQW